MNLLLTAINFFLANILFFYPVEARFHQPLQIAIVLLLGLSFFLQSFLYLRLKLFKGSREESSAPRPAPPETVIPAPAREADIEAGVVQFLGRLQEKGRLVDFVLDDIAPYSDEQVGAASRVVHQGCREVLQACFAIEPVHQGEEQESVSLAGDYDAGAYRLIGKVPERPPFRGTVLHRGWKTTRISLPRLTDEASAARAREIIAPAEVEIG